MDPSLPQRLRGRFAAAGWYVAEAASARWPDGIRGLPGFIRDAARKFPRPDRKTLSRVPPATAIVFFVGVAVAAGGYFAINEYAATRTRQELDRAVGDISRHVADAVDRHIALAESAASLFAGPDTRVNRWSFYKFAQTAAAGNAGLGAIEWVPRVAGSDRTVFEARAAADGLFDFHFADHAPDGRRVKAADRGEYFPVYFVEPYPGNETELGLDLGADAGVADFLARVRDSGKTTVAPAGLMTGRNRAVPGFSAIVPVYRLSGAPFTVEERRKALSGFVRADFRFDQLLESMRSGIGGLPAQHIYIFDRTDGGAPSLVYSFSAQDGERDARAIDPSALRAGMFASVDHEVAGWRWRIVAKPAGGTVQGVLGLTAWGFVGFTLLLTTLLLRHLTKMHLAREQAEAANRARSDFFAMMSHELRTPLNAVIGFSEMMVNEVFGPLSNDHYREYMAHINRSATHLLGMINSILDLSEAEAGSYKLEKEDCDLREIWASLFPVFETSLHDSGIELEENLSDSPLRLRADPRVFRQILHNIVSNAIKFTPRGGWVGVTAASVPGGGLTLRVADTGIGISDEDIDQVLKPFHQVDNSLSRKFEGVGVGLPLARLLVELHGGSLSIVSQPNEGTEITMKFPDAVIANAGAPVAVLPPRPDPQATAAEPESPPERKNAAKSG